LANEKFIQFARPIKHAQLPTSRNVHTQIPVNGLCQRQLVQLRAPDVLQEVTAPTAQLIFRDEQVM
jgi:hypothetical protein